MLVIVHCSFAGTCSISGLLPNIEQIQFFVFVEILRPFCSTHFVRIFLNLWDLKITPKLLRWGGKLML